MGRRAAVPAAEVCGDGLAGRGFRPIDVAQHAQYGFLQLPLFVTFLHEPGNRAIEIRQCLGKARIPIGVESHRAAIGMIARPAAVGAALLAYAPMQKSVGEIRAQHHEHGCVRVGFGYRRVDLGTEVHLSVDAPRLVDAAFGPGTAERGMVTTRLRRVPPQLLERCAHALFPVRLADKQHLARRRQQLVAKALQFAGKICELTVVGQGGLQHLEPP